MTIVWAVAAVICAALTAASIVDKSGWDQGARWMAIVFFAGMTGLFIYLGGADVIELLAFLVAAWPTLAVLVLIGLAAVGLAYWYERREAIAAAKHRHPASRSKRLP